MNPFKPVLFDGQEGDQSPANITTLQEEIATYMVIKFLPIKYASDDFLYLNFESLIEGQSSEYSIEGFLGEIWAPTHAVIKLSGILWIISMDEIKVELAGPLHPNDDLSLPAEWAFPKLTYIGSDQQLLQAARVDAIAQSPYLQTLLKGKRDNLEVNSSSSPPFSYVRG